jgi:hypothetical protein
MELKIAGAMLNTSARRLTSDVTRPMDSSGGRNSLERSGNGIPGPKKTHCPMSLFIRRDSY